MSSLTLVLGREYWAFTNEYGQLVRVIADEIILQDDSTEPVISSGRYYSDEAQVPGVEKADLDEGDISLLILLEGYRMLIISNHKKVRLTDMVIKRILKKVSATQVEQLILKPLSPIGIRKRRFLQVISIHIL